MWAWLASLGGRHEPTDCKGAEAAQAARRGLEQEKQRTREVHETAAALRELRTTNHFADLLEASMRPASAEQPNIPDLPKPHLTRTRGRHRRRRKP